MSIGAVHHPAGKRSAKSTNTKMSRYVTGTMTFGSCGTNLVVLWVEVGDKVDLV